MGQLEAVIQAARMEATRETIFMVALVVAWGRRRLSEVEAEMGAAEMEAVFQVIRLMVSVAVAVAVAVHILLGQEMVEMAVMVHRAL